MKRVALSLIFLFSPLFVFAALPTDVTILTSKDFLGRPYFSVGDALRGLTSIKIEQDGSRGTRMFAKMRGLDKDDVLVLLDGRPLTHEFNSAVDLTQLPLSMVDRIEITRGGVSSAYSAQAVAGTINIVTLRPDRRGLTSDIGTGVGRNGEKNVTFAFRGRGNAGDITYAPSNESSGGFSANEDFDTTNHFANFTRSFNGKGYWGGEYFYRDSRVGVSNGTAIPLEQWNGRAEQEPVTPFPERRLNMQHAKALLASPLMFGGTTYATFTESFLTSDANQTRGGVSLRHEDNQTLTLDVSWRGKLFEMGFQGNEFKRKIFPEDEHKVFENGVYGAAHWNFGNLLVAPGLRYDMHSRAGDFLAPRLALAYAAGKTFLISATGQRAHREPNFDEMFNSSAPVANGDLVNEKSWSGDAGFHWTPAHWFGFMATGFAARKTDVIAPNAAGMFQNDGVEKTNGVESEMKLVIGGNPDTSLDLSANWTFQNCRRSVADGSAFVDAAMSPKHLINVQLDKNFRHKIVISNEIRWQTEEFQLDDKQGIRVPGFYTWNLRLALKILAADIYAKVDNITNRHYAESIANDPVTNPGGVPTLSPMPARQYWAGVTIRFLN